MRFSNTVLEVLLSLLRMTKVESFSLCRRRQSVGIYDEPPGSMIGDTFAFRAQACYTRRQV